MDMGGPYTFTGVAIGMGAWGFGFHLLACFLSLFVCVWYVYSCFVFDHTKKWVFLLSHFILYLRERVVG